MAGKLTDLHGSLKVFFPSLLLSLPFVYLYTTVENLALSNLLIISTGFMVFLNSRFVPLMTLITQVPNQQERGSFMGVLMSLRAFTAASATAFSGILITENLDGSLQHFNVIGWISIALALMAIFPVLKLNRQVTS